MKNILFLLLFAAVQHVSAQSIEAYAADNSGSPTNIRNAPKGKTIHRISQNTIAMFILENPKNGWWKICDNSYFTVVDGYEGMVKLTGSNNGYWIHWSVLAVNTRNYGEQTLYLYQQPSTKSRKVFAFDEEMSLRPVDARGDWVKCITIDGRHTGWIQGEWLCGNVLTTCP